MRIYPEALNTHLKKGLLPIYLIYGTEPFLMEESAIFLRQYIKTTTSVEHLIFTPEPSSINSWQEIEGAQANRSLFSQRYFIDLRFPNKFSAAHTQALEKFLTHSQDNLILIQMGALSRQQQQTKWFLFVEKHGVVIPHWPPSRVQFGKWLQERAKLQGMSLNPPLLQLLISYTEGNCLKAAEEITRLALSHTPQNSSQSLADWQQASQFEVFELSEAILNQNMKRIITIISCFKKDQVIAPQLIIWALGQTLRLLQRASPALSEHAKQALLKQAGIRQLAFPAYSAALQKNYSHNACGGFLVKLAHIDQQIKGGETSLAWQGLLDLSLKMAKLMNS